MHRILQSAVAAALAATGAAHAADLTVPAGQTYVISAAQSDLRLDHLTLGDNARIAFAPGVSNWRVYAKQASIGQNVVIDGRGAVGAAGKPGAAREGKAKSCEDGRAGGTGEAGGTGGNGVALNLWWGVETLGSLAIQADGGNGGNGGNGGRGQDSGSVNYCEGPHGGQGGAGGRAGDGGKGGDVVLSYFAGAKAGTVSERIRISSVGGQPGTGGTGGTGGGASEGKFQRTPGGSDRWIKGGEPGTAGGVGAQGARGAAGAVQFEVAANGSGPAWRDEISAAPAPAVAQLQQQVEALQARSAVTAPSGQSQSVPDLLKQMQSRIDDLEERIRILEKR